MQFIKCHWFKYEKFYTKELENGRERAKKRKRERPAECVSSVNGWMNVGPTDGWISCRRLWPLDIGLQQHTSESESESLSAVKVRLGHKVPFL